MNLNKSLVLALFVFAFVSPVNSQNVKPKFKKIVYVTYRPTGSGKNLKISIDYYLEFNGNGTLHYLSNAYDGLLDTTYKIPDTLLVALNKVFDGSSRLKSHMVRHRFPSGTHFAGPLEYLSCTTYNHAPDNFIVVEGFNDEALAGLLDKISYLPYANVYHHGQIIKNKLIENEILKCHNACNYIPIIEEPPTVKELIKSN